MRHVAQWCRENEVIVVLFWLLVLTFCAETVAAQERPIRIGFPLRRSSRTSTFAASKRGFFRGDGLNVELIQIAGSPAVVALLSDDIDYITHNSRIVASAVRSGGVKSVFNYVANRSTTS